MCFFLFACKKKEDKMPLINANQYPKEIAFYTVDASNSTENFDFKMNYFYDNNNRFDSIKIVNTTYKFDYSQLSINGKVSLTNSDVSPIYDVITYDNVFYNLTSQVRSVLANDTVKRMLQYDSINRFRSYFLDNGLMSSSFTCTYKRDTVFVHSQASDLSCISNDTMFNSSVVMSKNLPFLVLTKSYNTCGGLIGSDILSALPLSSYNNKLPSKIISNDSQQNFIYSYDDNDRLIQIDISYKSRATNVVSAKIRTKISY